MYGISVSRWLCAETGVYMDVNLQHMVDKRVIRTKKAIKTALFALMEKKDFSAVTISELAAAAGVNRRTFYTHYHTITDILDEIECDLVSKLSDMLRGFDFSQYRQSVYKVFVDFYALVSSEEFNDYFRYMRMDTRGILTLRLRNALKTSALPRFADNGSGGCGGVVSAFAAGGILGSFMEWYYSEKRIPVESAAEAVSIMAEACAGAARNALML